ncbi:MAG: hypothetical protein U0792_17555 [Gemmataceae bacterium]
MIDAGVDRLYHRSADVPAILRHHDERAPEPDVFSGSDEGTAVPAVQVVPPPYYDHPAYIEVVEVRFATTAKLSWEPEHVVISYIR